MNSPSPKVLTQKNTVSENVGSRKKSSSRSTGSVLGKHVDAAAASAGLDSTIKSINNPIGLVPALGHLKPDDLSCVDQPEELAFGLPYIPPVNIPAFESRLEKTGRIPGLDTGETISPPIVDKFIQFNPMLADSLGNDINSPVTGHSLPGTCHLVSRSAVPGGFTGTTSVLPDSTLGLRLTDLTTTSPRFALLEPSVNFKLPDNPSFLQASFADDKFMLADARLTSRDCEPASDFRQTDVKSVSPNAPSYSFVKFAMAGNGPAFHDPPFPDAALVSSGPTSTGKAYHDTAFKAQQSEAGLIEMTTSLRPTSAQMPTTDADQTQTTESQALAENADSMAQAVPKIIADQCLGFKRSSLPRHSDSCRDCSEEERMLMARHNFSKEQLDELRETYLYFASPSEQLHETNFGRSLRAIGQNPSEENIRKMLTIASVRPEDGCITLDNYLTAIGCWGLRSEVDMIEDLIQAFKVFDEDDDERLDSANIRAALQNYAEPLDDEDVNRLLQLADSSPSGDGKLAFLSIIKSTAAHYVTQDLRANALSQ